MDPDLDKRLKAMEASLAASASTQRLGLLISLGFVSFALYQYFFAPPVLVATLRPIDCD